jgi:flagellar hook-associated protein 3 FlgL
MRVTQAAITNTSLAGIQASLANVQKYSAQASSGKRINLPSDDPQGTAVSMQLRAELSSSNQYTENGEFATNRLNTIDNALQQISSQLQQARANVVTSQDGQTSDTTRAALSAEMGQIKNALSGLYNTQYLGRPVFGGTSASGTTLDADNNYVGDGNPVMVQLNATTQVRVDTDGSTIGADSFSGLFDQLASDVNTSGGAPQADLDSLDSLLQAVSTATGNVGAAENQVTTVGNANTLRAQDLQASIQQNEGADLAETLTLFSATQVAYQTAVGVAAKVQNTSLLDFLR